MFPDSSMKKAITHNVSVIAFLEFVSNSWFSE